MNDLDFNISRNYLSDEIGERRLIYNHICNYFDIYQKSCKDGLKAKDIFAYVLKEIKGTVNPRLVTDVLKEIKGV